MSSATPLLTQSPIESLRLQNKTIFFLLLGCRQATRKMRAATRVLETNPARRLPKTLACPKSPSYEDAELLRNGLPESVPWIVSKRAVCEQSYPVQFVGARRHRHLALADVRCEGIQLELRFDSFGCWEILLSPPIQDAIDVGRSQALTGFYEDSSATSVKTNTTLIQRRDLELFELAVRHFVGPGA
jgi:hypothetical protein